MFLSVVWYVQCLAKNSIEFLHSQVWRSVSDSLAVKNFMKNLITTTCVACSQNPTALVSKLSNFQSSYWLLNKLNASRRKLDGNIIRVLRKTDYANPKQAVDGYLKK